jgi:hypothetical protein
MSVTSPPVEPAEQLFGAGDATFGPSEANAVIDNFNKLPEVKKQDLLNFLRSL